MTLLICVCTRSSFQSIPLYGFAVPFIAMGCITKTILQAIIGRMNTTPFPMLFANLPNSPSS